MASLSLLKNWLDDALLPYLRQDWAHAAETLEAFLAVWPEDALARSALVSCWLHLLEEASQEEAPALRERLKEQRDFLLAPEEPAGWLSAWNRARFLHLCRARPALEAPRSQLALYAALRDVGLTLDFSPFDFHAQATRARVLRALEREEEAFRIVRRVEVLLPGFEGLSDMRAAPEYQAWRERTPPTEELGHEPSVPTAVAAVLRPGWAQAWEHARDVALGALALEVGRHPAELTLTHPGQLDVWRGRFHTLGPVVELSHHALTLLRHWVVMARNHPRLSGGPRRYLFPRWEDLAPLSGEEVASRFESSAFPGPPAPPQDGSNAEVTLRSAGSVDRVHAQFAGVEEGARADLPCHSHAELREVLRRLGSERVRHLKLRGPLGLDGVARLVRAPGVEHLRSLHLPLGEVGPEAARVLARAPTLSGLRELVLDGNPLGPQGLAALVEGPGLGGLRSLSLMGCGLGPEGVERLGRSTLVLQLEVLDLGANAVGEGLGAWAEQEGPWALQVLGLGHNHGMAGAGLAAWLSGPRASRLRWLDVEHCRVGDGLLEALAGSPHLERLAVLQLGRNALTATGLGALERAGLPRLVWLELGGNRFGAEGTDALSRAGWSRGLLHLGLADTGADPARLLASSNLERLRSLNLDDCGVSEEVAQQLLTSPRLPRLERLSVATSRYG